MAARLGAKVVDVLEQAGERHLKKAAPRAYAALLLQVGGADTLREYAASVTYWEHVQVILDHFFTSPERAEIVARLMERSRLYRRPECRSFLDHARAERRVQELIAVVASMRAPNPSKQSIAARRAS
jgi:hypothetical protein